MTDHEFRRKLNDLRVLIEAFQSFDEESLPFPFHNLAIQVRSASHRVEIESALAAYGFDFGDITLHEVGGGTYASGTEVPRSVHGNRTILRGGRQVAYLYGDESAFVPSTTATFGLLSALHADLPPWADEAPEEEPEGPLPGDDEGEVDMVDAPDNVSLAWRVRPLGGNREYVEPVVP
jgi:hypothetical protein